MRNIYVHLRRLHNNSYERYLTSVAPGKNVVKDADSIYSHGAFVKDLILGTDDHDQTISFPSASCRTSVTF
jgi:hypothetical protein